MKNCQQPVSIVRIFRKINMRYMHVKQRLIAYIFMIILKNVFDYTLTIL